MMKMSLGSTDVLEFNTGVADVNGAYWYVNGLEGWDSPALSVVSSRQTQRHGGVLSSSLLEPRAVLVSGLCKTTTEERYWASFNRLMSVTSNLLVEHPFTLWEGETAKRLMVVRGDQVRVDHSGVGSFEFQIPLTAYDPLKYVTTASTTVINAGGTGTANNAGTFISERLIATTSSAGTVYLQNQTTGRVLQLSSVPAGTILDFKNRSIILASGISGYKQLLMPSTWWGLLPGANAIKNSGTANVTISYYSAWV